jgi:hypothetical protein
VSEPIRLVMVTDNPDKAAPAIFGMALNRLPGWVLVMTDYREIIALDEGSPCIAIWFPINGQPSIAEMTWREYRQTLKLDDDFGKHFDRVTAWLEKRRAAELDLLAKANAEDRENEGLMTWSEFSTAQAAAKAVETATVKRFPQQSKWS